MEYWTAVYENKERNEQQRLQEQLVNTSPSVYHLSRKWKCVCWAVATLRYLNLVMQFKVFAANAIWHLCDT